MLYRMLGVLALASSLLLVWAASISAKGQGSRLTLIQGQTWHSYTLPKAIEVDMDEARVLDFQRKGDLGYVLLEVTGPSKRGSPLGYCGAGTEGSTLWLQLRGWKLERVRWEKHQSCFYSIEANPAQWSGRVLKIEFWDYRTMKQKILTYDRTQPQQGFLLSEKPIKP